MTTTTTRLISALLLVAACGGGSDDPPGADGATDGPSGGADAPLTDGGGGTDGGGPLTTCAAGARVDEVGGVSGATALRFGVIGDRWVATWQQVASVSPDSQYHAKGRIFDGATFGDVLELGIDVYGNSVPIVTDSAGRAWFQRYSGNPSGDRFRFDLVAGTVSSNETFTLVNAGSDPHAIASYPSGGAISAYNAGGAITIERWTPAAPTWTAIPLAGTPTTNPGEIRVATNDAGQAVVAWLHQTAGGDTEIQGAIHDGATTWSPIATLTFPSGTPGAGTMKVAMLSTGDAVITYLRGSSVEQTLLHAAGTIDAPTPITTELTSSYFDLILDGWDRQTLLTYEMAGSPHAIVRRNVSGTWGPARDFGVASSAHIVEDLADGHVAVLTYASPTLSVARTTDPGGDEFSASVPTPIGLTSTMSLPLQASAIFGTDGSLTVIAIDQLEPSGSGIATAICR